MENEARSAHSNFLLSRLAAVEGVADFAETNRAYWDRVAVDSRALAERIRARLAEVEGCSPATVTK